MNLAAQPAEPADGAGHGATNCAGGAARQAGGLRAALPAVLLIGVLSLAAGLRAVGLDWDRGGLFHPDERRILLVVNELRWPRPGEWAQLLGPRSPLNPRFFAYGSLPLYLLRLVQALLGLPIARLYLAGRALSAAFGLLTVAAVYAIGRRLGGRGVGLLAAAFLALAALPIQLSHYGTVDSLLVLLCTLAVYALLEVSRSGSLRAGLAAGALTGFALATKTSALPLLFVGWAAWALWALRGRRLPLLGRGLGGLLAGTVAAALAFLLAEPYSLLDWFRFGSALFQESAMAQGWAIFPYTRQYVGTLPYLYQLRELVLWSLGLPLGLLGLVGLAWFTWRGLRGRRSPDLVILAWFWPYFLITGALHAKFPRYLAPLIPWLCVMAALFLGRLWAAARARSWLRPVTAALAAVVLLATALYALATAAMYTRPHPWLAASDWICSQAPPGATLALEAWDDDLPAAAYTCCLGRYRYLRPDSFAPDGVGKLDRLVATLAEADYIVLPSQRVYGTLGRLAGEYPLTSAYFRLLFAERLGFRLAAVETNYPRLGPLAIVDEPLRGTPLQRPALLAAQQPAPLVLNLGHADESYAVYDHPRVLIFKKERSLSPQELRALLTTNQ